MLKYSIIFHIFRYTGKVDHNLPASMYWTVLMMFTYCTLSSASIACKTKQNKEFRGLSPRVNHIDQATAACRWRKHQLSRIEVCHVVSVTDPRCHFNVGNGSYNPDYYYYYYYYFIELQMGFYPAAVVLQQDKTHKNTHITQITHRAQTKHRIQTLKTYYAQWIQQQKSKDILAKGHGDL
jgi:hypothetical protein